MPSATVKLDEIEWPEIHGLFEYWSRLCGDATDEAAGLPSRRSIDPACIAPSLLPRIKIAQRMEQGWRYRLVGSAFRELAGMELSNRFIDEVENPAYANHLAELFQTACEARAAHLCEARYLGVKGMVERSVARLVLPLSDTGKVDAVMVGAYWTNRVDDPVTSVSLVALEYDPPVRLVG